VRIVKLVRPDRQTSAGKRAVSEMLLRRGAVILGSRGQAGAVEIFAAADRAIWARVEAGQPLRAKAAVRDVEVADVLSQAVAQFEPDEQSRLPYEVTLHGDLFSQPGHVVPAGPVTLEAFTRLVTSLGGEVLTNDPGRASSLTYVPVCLDPARLPALADFPSVRSIRPAAHVALR
jgi:hypothetical protein